MQNKFPRKAFWVGILSIFSIVILLKQGAISVSAYEPTMAPGISVQGIDLEGMTKSQAISVIESYVYRLLENDKLIYIQYKDIAQETPGAAVFGAKWSNRELLDKLILLGNEGNVVERYKTRKDMEQNPVDYKVELTFDEATIASYLESKMTKYNQKVVDYSLVRNNNSFQVIDGKVGYEVNVEASAKEICDYLSNSWDFSAVYFPLQIEVVQPRGSHEELASVTDLIGSFTSSFKGGSSAKVTNISNGSKLINAITLYPEEEFSFDAYAAPYTIANGYAMGQSYSGGKLVNDVGGGICQVSSTLYNAVLRAELDVTMRYNHSMIVGYVPISSDATLAETSGKDFRFKNDQDVPIYIESYLTNNQQLVVNIYGKETRPSNRTVEYYSETVEVINPPPDVINVSASMPVGQIQVSSAYTGYKAKLWKIVKVNGKEQSREQVNSSNYRAVARMATVGMATSDPVIAEQMNAAVATGNIDHVKNVIASIMAPPVQQEVTEE